MKQRPDSALYTCGRCGEFTLTRTAAMMVDSYKPTGRVAANASAWIREHQGITIASNDVNQLWTLRAPSVAERAMKLLQELGRRYPEIGTRFMVQFPDIARTEPSLLAVSWSASGAELHYLFFSYLRGSLSALDIRSTVRGPDTDLAECWITPKGFALLQELRQGNPQSEIGFCAMWFSDELKPLWTDGIEPGIQAAGYEALRIDQHEHVNRIDDEIIAAIRRSRFVVADFTGQRGGVYFEAGYALGQGLRVIWICREDEIEKVHFDTRQYNFLAWKLGEYGDLAKRLQNRIEATLGRGPVKE